MSYWTVHNRLRETRGRASEYLCIACGSRACEWALQPSCTAPLISTSGTGIGCPYSEDLNDYAPMCRSCHSLLDADDRVRAWGRTLGNTYGREGGRLGGPRGARTTNAIRRQCGTCGLVSSPGPLALHLRKLGHEVAE